MRISKLGRYDVIGELGRGAGGCVYQGRDPATNRLVAIKMLRLDMPGAAGDWAEVLKAFRRVVQTAMNLSHPNIVTTYEHWHAGNMVFLAMEYVPGPTLEAIMSRGDRLPLPLVAHLISQICDALDYAHEYDIVHGAVKPSNVLLLDAYRVKVTDFAMANGVAWTLSQTGVRPRAAYSTAPEVLAGTRADGRADLYAVGAILYELLTGVRCSASPSPDMPAQAIFDTEAPAPSTVDPTLPAGVDELLGRALATRPADRYPTGAALVADLRLLPGTTGPLPRHPLRAPSPLWTGGEAPFRAVGIREPAPSVVGLSGVRSRGEPAPSMGAFATVADRERVAATRLLAPDAAPPAMVAIAGGLYRIGTNTGAFGDGPEHEVHVAPFCLDQYPVTNYQYQRFRPRHTYPRDQGDHPVTGISWYEAHAYAEAHGKRLPTNAEWEAAARGMTARAYPWGAEFREFRCNVDSHGTVEVTQYPSGCTPEGVHDLVGNVWEWTQDAYVRYPGSTAVGPLPARMYRTVRGGSWRTSAAQATTTARHKLLPGTKADDVGFRCACDDLAPF